MSSSSTINLTTTTIRSTNITTNLLNHHINKSYSNKSQIKLIKKQQQVEKIDKDWKINHHSSSSSSSQLIKFNQLIKLENNINSKTPIEKLNSSKSIINLIDHYLNSFKNIKQAIKLLPSLQISLNSISHTQLNILNQSISYQSPTQLSLSIHKSIQQLILIKSTLIDLDSIVFDYLSTSIEINDLNLNNSIYKFLSKLSFDSIAFIKLWKTTLSTTKPSIILIYWFIKYLIDHHSDFIFVKSTSNLLAQSLGHLIYKLTRQRNSNETQIKELLELLETYHKLFPQSLSSNELLQRKIQLYHHLNLPIKSICSDIKDPYIISTILRNSSSFTNNQLLDKLSLSDLRVISRSKGILIYLDPITNSPYLSNINHNNNTIRLENVYQNRGEILSLAQVLSNLPTKENILKLINLKINENHKLEKNRLSKRQKKGIEYYIKNLLKLNNFY
ncbi:hypothetical protein CROQUDRAFT_86285 [Cronartium quercuum f. sp. fusiforme G11]|uniref:Uncharacterized protein n=1 Tax=Cronartium quercuum f. sp. fusiforme G11 TaxID=708437 RepID=A0A9P6TGD8_9BASI|nr:hypothetical protein CROQUDRAFT_86285 [Cronartium quercuum f. sp. fusiforme G11]